MLATLTARFWTALAAIGAFLALLGGAWLKGRSAGTQAARVRAAQDEQRARDRGNAAAADAERDGAAKRLRDGSF